MNLLTLNLHKPLAWSTSQAAEAGVRSASDAVRIAASSAEGAELALSWNWETVVDERGDDGPRAVRPLAAPASAAASGLPGPSANDAGLAPGRYLFVQSRAPSGPVDLDAWLLHLIEWFAREAWWTGASCAGDLTLRLVREDGKTAVQLLRPLDEEQKER